MGSGYLNDDGYTAALDILIVAFCRSYYARAQAIKTGKYKKRTLMEYEYINLRLEDAAREIAGDDFEKYINEIGMNIGYANSDVDYVSEMEYKRTKREVKLNIAKKLHLLD